MRCRASPSPTPGFYRSTVYGGYHRGMSTGVLRNEDFPSPDEIGDNFNLGFRSSAIKGFDFEVAGFYQLFEDFQYGESFSAIAGDRSFGRADEVEISGVELYGRLNSQPFTGGPLNFFAEGNYTYARGILKTALHLRRYRRRRWRSFSGNHVPEVPVPRRRSDPRRRGHHRLALERQCHLYLPRRVLHRREPTRPTGWAASTRAMMLQERARSRKPAKTAGAERVAAVGALQPRPR